METKQESNISKNLNTTGLKVKIKKLRRGPSQSVKPMTIKPMNSLRKIRSYIPKAQNVSN